jgi:hypothetical protein
MKLHALLIAVALAAGSAFAAPHDSAKPPAGDAGSKSATVAASPDTAPAKVQKKKSRKAHAKHASARHHQQHASAHRHHMHASAHRHHMHARLHGHHTRAMGAGPTGRTDLNAQTRQQRMDAAYADWQARRR